MEKNLVKCDECGYKFFTKAQVDEETQCPHKSGGCGHRFPVKGNLIKI